MGAADDAPILTVRSRAELRAWLAANHATARALWLASYKKHHPDYLAYEPQVEELLCWGWIDSVTRALDADRSMILIAPRNPKSAWSAMNKAHVARARATGAMTPAGEAKIAAAQANGMWDFLNDVDALLDPPDLTDALNATGTAAFWAALPRSIRRGTLEWVKTAKTPATRARRIADITDSAARASAPAPSAADPSSSPNIPGVWGQRPHPPRRCAPAQRREKRLAAPAAPQDHRRPAAPPVARKAPPDAPRDQPFTSIGPRGRPPRMCRW